MPDERKNGIMHARLKVGDAFLMASDSLMAPSASMAGASVTLNYLTAAEAKTVFDRRADGGEVQMASAPIFLCAGLSKQFSVSPSSAGAMRGIG